MRDCFAASIILVLACFVAVTTVSGAANKKNRQEETGYSDVGGYGGGSGVGVGGGVGVGSSGGVNLDDRDDAYDAKVYSNKNEDGIELRKGAPLLPAKGAHDKSNVPIVVGQTPSALSQEVIEPFPYDFSKFGFGFDMAKLLFNPIELVKLISGYFKIPAERLTVKLGHGLVYGFESIFQPVLASIKIIEKVFQPDHCRLGFICRAGASFGSFREQLNSFRFSPGYFDGSYHFKAFADGLMGRESCEVLFPQCELKLKKPFELLKLGA